MRTLVSVTRTVDCAHQLDETELHGHTYRVTAVIAGEPGEDGILMSFEGLGHELTKVLLRVNHRQLENTIGSPATAERFAAWVMDTLIDKQGLAVSSVRVQVGDSGYAEVFVE